MKTKNTKYIVMLGASLALLTSSCRKGCTDPNAINYDDKAKKEDNSCEYEDTSDNDASININFTHMIGSQSFAFNQDFTDDHGNTCEFTRAQMYISNPLYFDDQGVQISAPSEYLLVSPSESTYSIGTLPAESHVHTMDLLIGVDSVANHSDPASYSSGHPLAYQSPSIHWNWNSGYIFIAIEGHVDIDGNGTYDAGEDFLMHVGMNSMARDVQGLLVDFNAVGGMTHNIQLDIDWAELVAGIDLSVDNSSHTMDNMPLAMFVANNAQNAISIHQ